MLSDIIRHSKVQISVTPQAGVIASWRSTNYCILVVVSALSSSAPTYSTVSGSSSSVTGTAGTGSAVTGSGTGTATGTGGSGGGTGTGSSATYTGSSTVSGTAFGTDHGPPVPTSTTTQSEPVLRVVVSLATYMSYRVVF